MNSRVLAIVCAGLLIWQSGAEARPIRNSMLSSVTDALEFSDVPSRVRASVAERARWWKDPLKTHLATSLPISGVGKITDVVAFYKKELKPVGVDTLLFMPHFWSLNASPHMPPSPYAPASKYAINPELIDFSVVPEEMKRRGPLYDQFVAENSWWLDDFASAMALYRFLSPRIPFTDPLNPATTTQKDRFVYVNPFEDEEAAAIMKTDKFKEQVEFYKYVQWIGDMQMQEMLQGLVEAGANPLFDIPMFSAKNSVDVWTHPEFFSQLESNGSPGLMNQWTQQVWEDLALYNWTELGKYNFEPLTKPFDYWLSKGFKGGRIDALHMAYRLDDRHGQLCSGDEPGDAFVTAVVDVFQKHGALPIAEAFNDTHEAIEGLGVVTVKSGDWKQLSCPDDPRMFTTKEAFLEELAKKMFERGSGKSARFISFTLGDQWGDTVPLKRMVDGLAQFSYKIPGPDDTSRSVYDAREDMKSFGIAVFNDVWKHPELIQELFERAADTFVKHATLEGEDVYEIWAASRDWFFEQWGRDTFIALPGLLLSTGRFEEAKSVIRSFARFEQDGIIPNRVYSADHILYNNVDGSLWFIHAIEQYVCYTDDWSFVEEMAPVVFSIIEHYQAGTGYVWQNWWHEIKMDTSDGLLISPAQGTWMDADPDVNAYGVTPRHGKAVEINALWFVALRFCSILEYRYGGEHKARRWADFAKQIRTSFLRSFWNEDEQALYDAVKVGDYGDPHGAAIRPNMLFAVGYAELDSALLKGFPEDLQSILAVPLLEERYQNEIVEKAREELLTPYGMRTLSPRDSFYNTAYYTGKDPSEKDWAYHQGTVWPWLIGVYCDSRAVVMKQAGASEDAIKAELRMIVTPLVEFLFKSPYHSINEVFDGGDPDWPMLPQIPGGTSAQAWSVSEVLRIIEKHDLLSTKASSRVKEHVALQAA